MGNRGPLVAGFKLTVPHAHFSDPPEPTVTQRVSSTVQTKLLPFRHPRPQLWALAAPAAALSASAHALPSSQGPFGPWRPSPTPTPDLPLPSCANASQVPHCFCASVCSPAKGGSCHGHPCVGSLGRRRVSEVEAERVA